MPSAALIARTMPAPDWVTPATIGSLLDPVTPGMIGCHAVTPGMRLAHLRADPHGAPVDWLEPREIAVPKAAETIDAAIWGGPLFLHFGHLVAESIHRLWAAHLPDLAGLPILFPVAADDDPWRHPWVEPVLALCGVPRARVRIVRDPLRVGRLAVPVQGRVLGGPALVPGYPQLFPLAPLPPPPADASRHVYVSRAASLHAGSYLGETLVERVMGEAGFAILRPEAMPVADLVARLAAAGTIVFAEGSAIHNLELIGPTAARVFVIGRRPGVKRRFAALLDSLSDTWSAFAAGPSDLALDWDTPLDAPRLSRGCSVPDLPRLVAAIAGFSGLDLAVPDPAGARAAQREDLLRLLLHPAAGGGSDDRQLGLALRRLRQSTLLAALHEPS